VATNKKITELTELVGADLAADDVIPIVDISAGTTHKIQKSTLAAAVAGVAELAATTPIAVDTATGDVTVSISATPSFTSVSVTGDTSAGDDAKIGYTSAEGLILTGQGSTNDVTIKNDADADVITIATGATNVDIVGDVTAATINADGDTSASDSAAIGYTSAEGIIITGQGSTNDVTIKNDADADVITIATGATNVDIVGDVTASTINADGDTAASDSAAMGYTSAEGLILTGQGSTNDVTIKNDADTDVITIATGGTDVAIAGGLTLGTDLSVANGGTGASTFTANNVLLGNGTSAFQVIAPSTDGNVLTSTGTTWQSEAAATAAVTSYTNSTDNRVITSVDSVTINGEANLTFDGSTLAVTGNVTTTGTVEPAGDTSAADNAAFGYTSVLGAIITGQGSTNDVTLVNDADGTVLGIPTGTTNVEIAGSLTLGTDLSVANGGTGASTHTANNVLVGAGTSAISSVAPSTSGNVLTSNGSAWTSAAAGGGGKVLQVVQGTTTATSSTTSTSWVTTGLSVAITPAHTSNKILVWTNAWGGQYGPPAGFALFRGTTQITDNDGNEMDAGYVIGYDNAEGMTPVVMCKLDSPSSTSSITYSLYWITESSTIYFNRPNNRDTRSGMCSITCMEIDGT